MLYKKVILTCVIYDIEVWDIFCHEKNSFSVKKFRKHAFIKLCAFFKFFPVVIISGVLGCYVFFHHIFPALLKNECTRTCYNVR